MLVNRASSLLQTYLGQHSVSLRAIRTEVAPPHVNTCASELFYLRAGERRVKAIYQDSKACPLVHVRSVQVLADEP